MSASGPPEPHQQSEPAVDPDRIERGSLTREEGQRKLAEIQARLAAQREQEQRGLAPKRTLSVKAENHTLSVKPQQAQQSNGTPPAPLRDPQRQRRTAQTRPPARRVARTAAKGKDPPDSDEPEPPARRLAPDDERLIWAHALVVARVMLAYLRRAA
jgi:hypothetical protein